VTGAGKAPIAAAIRRIRLKRKHTGTGSAKPTVTETVINVTRDGEWLPSDEFRAVALSAAGAESNLIINLQAVDHLDASALQILLALAAERKKRGKGLRLANTSAALSRWFEYAGGRENLAPQPEV
jgi:anti-anti-sigma factor